MPATDTSAYWQRFYDQRARRNTTTNFMQALGYHPSQGGDYQALFDRLLALIKDRLELAPEHDLLDIACGFGAFTRLLGKEVRFAAGTDLTGILLARGFELERELGFPPVAGFVQANASAQPFADRSFDRILCFGMFFHLDPDSARRVVLEILRLLRPGGRALIGDVLHPGRLHYERSYVDRVPSWLHYSLNQVLRIKGKVDGWRGRVVFQAYAPGFFQQLLPAGARGDFHEGMRDGRRNNLSRYDVVIQLGEG